MNFVKNKNFLLFRNVFIEIILVKCLMELILCILAPIGTASFCFCSLSCHTELVEVPEGNKNERYSG